MSFTIVSYLIIILWITLEKGECFDFNHSLGCVYPTLYTSRLSLSFQLADLLSLLIYFKIESYIQLKICVSMPVVHLIHVTTEMIFIYLYKPTAKVWQWLYWSYEWSEPITWSKVHIWFPCSVQQFSMTDR